MWHVAYFESNEPTKVTSYRPIVVLVDVSPYMYCICASGSSPCIEDSVYVYLCTMYLCIVNQSNKHRSFSNLHRQYLLVVLDMGWARYTNAMHIRANSWSVRCTTRTCMRWKESVLLSNLYPPIYLAELGVVVVVVVVVSLSKSMYLVTVLNMGIQAESQLDGRWGLRFCLWKSLCI